jgi:hypothetical protein
LSGSVPRAKQTNIAITPAKTIALLGKAGGTGL